MNSDGLSSDSTDRRFSRAAAAVCWAFTVAIVAAYAAFMVGLIRGHTAVPYFDQANYVVKTYNLADSLADRGALALLDPAVLLATSPPNRGVLLPLVAAVVFGRDADPRHMALLWLGTRLLALLVAFAVLARLTRRTAFLPAAAMIILASWSQLMLDPSVLMVDQAFECFGLLAFALALRDLEVRSAGSAALVGAATILLAEVKPAAVVFMAPVYAVIAVSFLVEARSPGRSTCLWSWALPHAVTAILLLLVMVSPYGAAVRSQYGLARAGYWWWGYTFEQLWILVVLMIPIWLAALAVISLVRHGRRGLPQALLISATLTAVSWYAFNTLLMHLIDHRLVAAAMPVAVTSAAIVTCRTRGLALTATGCAMVVFGVAMASASGRLAYPSNLAYINLVPHRQQAVPEVGLLPLVQRTALEIERLEPPGDVPIAVMAVMNDSFADSDGAMPVALRRASIDRPARIRFAHLPFGSDPTALERVVEIQWFFTKARRKAVPLAADAWTILESIDALITDPASPLHANFESQFSHPVHQPDLDDEITLWRSRRRPTADDFLRALRWLEPRFRATPGHAALLQRIAGLSNVLERLPNEESDTVMFHLDRFQQSPAGTQIDGWAFDQEFGTGSQIFVVVQRPSGSRDVFNTIAVERPDVSAHFKRPNLDDSGFSLFLPHRGLERGNHRVGLYIAGPDAFAFRLTPHTLIVN